MPAGAAGCKWALFVVGLALLSSLTAIVSLGSDRVSFGDAADYSYSAHALLHGSYPRESPRFPVFRPPLYPLLISAVWAVTSPGNVVGVKVVQAFMFAATALILCALGRRLHGDEDTAAVGAVLYALYPFAILLVTDIQTEAFHSLLVGGAVYALVCAVGAGRVSIGWLITAGVLFGVATLCRPSALPIGLLLCVAVPWCFASTWRPAKRLLVSVAAVVACVGPILPWTYLNWRATGEFLLVSDAAGYQLWLGNHPQLLRGYQEEFKNPQEFNRFQYSYLQNYLVQQQIKDWERTTGYASLSLGQRERLWRDEAIRNMAASPSTTARLWLSKLAHFWRPWLSPSAYSPAVVAGSGVIVSGLYALALAGIFMVIRGGSGGALRSSRGAWLLLLLFASSAFVHLPFHTMFRFRLPYVDPYLTVFAAVPLVAVYRRVWARRTPT